MWRTRVGPRSELTQARRTAARRKEYSTRTFINVKGKESIHSYHTEALTFGEGLAAVKKYDRYDDGYHTKWGYTGTNGNEYFED